MEDYHLGYTGRRGNLTIGTKHTFYKSAVVTAGNGKNNSITGEPL